MLFAYNPLVLHQLESQYIDNHDAFMVDQAINTIRDATGCDMTAGGLEYNYYRNNIASPLLEMDDLLRDVSHLIGHAMELFLYEEKKTLLHFAVKYMDKTNIEMLCRLMRISVDHQDSEGMTASHYAVKRGNLVALLGLHESGANLNIQNNSGVSAIDMYQKLLESRGLHFTGEPPSAERIKC